MSRAEIIDGKAVAAALRAEVAAAAADLAEAGTTPSLAVVLVGDDPASEIYVRNKGRQAKAAGMRSHEKRLPATASEEEVVATVAALNKDASVHGILVQLPLPKHISSDRVIAAIDPDKDVDGLHPLNAGRLLLGQEGHVACTPSGCLTLIKAQRGAKLDGLHAVIVGRSILVGKPMGLLLLEENCTVTTAHSRTRDLPALCRTADILVAAVGKPELVRSDWIKTGATVIDVGINRLAAEGDDGKGRIVGDVAFDEVAAVAGAITPVPGGVGPMTIASLLRNTVNAAATAAGKRRPEFSLG